MVLYHPLTPDKLRPWVCSLARAFRRLAANGFDLGSIVGLDLRTEAVGSENLTNLHLAVRSIATVNGLRMAAEAAMDAVDITGLADCQNYTVGVDRKHYYTDCRVG